MSNHTSTNHDIPAETYAALLSLRQDEYAEVDESMNVVSVGHVDRLTSPHPDTVDLLWLDSNGIVERWSEMS